MTADPAHFPGFRISIEQALERGLVPCGTTTALATYAHGGRQRRVGVLVSNLAFQAGSFDMASGEKFCRLLVRCARRRMPVVCFISSGGMQTKEGAGLAVLDGDRQRPHHSLRARQRSSDHGVRFRRLHRRRAGLDGDSPVGRHVLLLRLPDALRRPDRRAIASAHDVDAEQLPVGGSGGDAGPWSSTPSRSSSTSSWPRSIQRCRCPAPPSTTSSVWPSRGDGWATSRPSCRFSAGARTRSIVRSRRS